MNPRPRDSQRKQVYEAERLAYRIPQGIDLREWEGHNEATWPMTLDQVRSFSNSVVGSSFWIEHGGPDNVAITDGRSRKRGAAWPDLSKIALPRFARRRYYALHELAHLLTPLDAAWHGPEWVCLYVALVERFCGVAAAVTLVGAMRLTKVRRHTQRELHETAVATF